MLRTHNKAILRPYEHGIEGEMGRKVGRSGEKEISWVVDVWLDFLDFRLFA